MNNPMNVAGFAAFLVVGVLCSCLRSVAEDALYLRGTCVETVLTPSGVTVTNEAWNCEAYVGDSGFSYSLTKRGDTNIIFQAGGQSDLLVTVASWPPGSINLGHVSTYAKPDALGWAPGLLLYPMLANHSQAITGLTNLPIESMIQTVYGNALGLDGVAQTWSYEDAKPFSVRSMEAYVLPGRTPLEQAAYPDGWKIGEIAVLKKSDRHNIPTLVEARYFMPRKVQGGSPASTYTRQNTLVQSVVRLAIDTVETVSVTTYLPQPAKGVMAEDYRLAGTGNTASQYWLKPGEPWPLTKAELLARQSEAAARAAAVAHAQRKPALLVIGLMLFFSVTMAVIVMKTKQKQTTPTTR
jgi:hypothetical protein